MWGKSVAAPGARMSLRNPTWRLSECEKPPQCRSGGAMGVVRSWGVCFLSERAHCKGTSRPYCLSRCPVTQDLPVAKALLIAEPPHCTLISTSMYSIKPETDPDVFYPRTSPSLTQMFLLKELQCWCINLCFSLSVKLLLPGLFFIIRTFSVLTLPLVVLLLIWIWFPRSWEENDPALIPSHRIHPCCCFLFGNSSTQLQIRLEL